MATHLRAVNRADGDEVAEVISRHYLDALAAVPDAADVPQIRAHAIDMLVRAAERSLRAGAPRAAASSYVSAAQQTELSVGALDNDADRTAARLWELAARAASTAFDLEGSLAYAHHASELYAADGQPRAAARVQALAGDALRRSGRHVEARGVRVPPWTCFAPTPTSTPSPLYSVSSSKRSSRGGRTRMHCRPKPLVWVRRLRSTRASSPSYSSAAALPSASPIVWSRQPPISTMPLSSPREPGTGPRRPEPSSTWLTS